jgi:hypothetical protein
MNITTVKLKIHISVGATVKYSLCPLYKGKLVFVPDYALCHESWSSGCVDLHFLSLSTSLK